MSDRTDKLKEEPERAQCNKGSKRTRAAGTERNRGSKRRRSHRNSMTDRGEERVPNSSIQSFIEMR